MRKNKFNKPFIKNVKKQANKIRKNRQKKATIMTWEGPIEFIYT
jgi:hypothetical protein